MGALGPAGGSRLSIVVQAHGLHALLQLLRLMGGISLRFNLGFALTVGGFCFFEDIDKVLALGDFSIPQRVEAGSAMTYRAHHLPRLVDDRDGLPQMHHDVEREGCVVRCSIRELWNVGPRWSVVLDQQAQLAVRAGGARMSKRRLMGG